jgi:hypothetical protein
MLSQDPFHVTADYIEEFSMEEPEEQVRNSNGCFELEIALSSVGCTQDPAHLMLGREAAQ